MQLNPSDGETYVSMVEMMFVFSMIWSMCASVDEDGRKKIDSYLREIEGSFPNKVQSLVYPVRPQPTGISDALCLLPTQLSCQPVGCEPLS